MSNSLSPELLAQLYASESNDPFLMLVTLVHPDWPTVYRLVDNNVDIVSRTLTYTAFPMKIRLPVDDGETARQVTIEFDNVGLDLISELRSITTPISVTLEMILASNTDQVQITLDGLQIKSITYNSSTISATLLLDDFLNTAMTEEQYDPQRFPGLF